MKYNIAVRVWIVTLLSAALLWAGEPWKEKPYTEWTERDIERVLLQSPWARQVLVKSAGTVLVNNPLGHIPRPEITEIPVTEAFLVQWASARTIRQAVARFAELRASPDKGARAQALSVSPAEHAVVVLLPKTGQFRDITEAGVQESAYLRLKRSKNKILPLNVRFTPQGRDVTAIEFRFPRQVDGTVTIPANENTVSFSCQLGEARISVDFDLRKMLRDGKPDL